MNQKENALKYFSGAMANLLSEYIDNTDLVVYDVMVILEQVWDKAYQYGWDNGFGNGRNYQDDDEDWTK